VKKANAMRPAQFATLFNGEPNPLAQSFAKDLKLMDAILAVVHAPLVCI